MDWLETLTGETRMRLLRLVRGSALSIGELAEALGISENAVRGHVAAAERDGLVRQAGVQRGTGGKPARLYELSPGAEELFPKAYALVFTELVRTLREEDGDDAVVERLRRVGRRLGARAGGQADGEPGAEAAPDAAAGVAAAAALLESIGGSAEVVEASHGWMIQANGCPLSGLVTEDPQVCALAEALVAEVTGRRVIESCEKSGRPRCAFRVLDDNPGDRRRST